MSLLAQILYTLLLVCSGKPELSNSKNALTNQQKRCRAAVWQRVSHNHNSEEGHSNQKEATVIRNMQLKSQYVQ